MKTTLLLFFISLLTLPLVMGQSADKGQMNIDVGFGVAGYGTHSNLGESRRVGAAALIADLDFGYFIKDRLSIGLNVISNYRYLGESADSSVDHVLARGGGIGFNGRYHVLNKPKFQYYVGSMIGVTGLNYERLDTSGVLGELYLNGGMVGLQTGFRALFSKVVGFHMKASFTTHIYHARRFAVNGEERQYIGDLKTTELLFNFRGLEFLAGITFVF
jgi:hypothetical protein